MKGFTLVEMLVALFIFALITAAGITVMRFTVDSQAIIRGHVDGLAALQRARAILKADLTQAVARRTRDSAGRPVREAFYGGSTNAAEPLLRFVRLGRDNPDAQPRASAQYVEYRVADGRLQRAARFGLDGGAMGPPQTLLDGVRDVKIAFLWRGQWLDTLPGGPENPLPQAVRLDMTLGQTGRITQLFAVTGAPQ